MKKLRPNLTPDYSGQGLSTLKKAVSQLLATRAIPELVIYRT